MDAPAGVPDVEVLSVLHLCPERIPQCWSSFDWDLWFSLFSLRNP